MKTVYLILLLNCGGWTYSAVAQTTGCYKICLYGTCALSKDDCAPDEQPFCVCDLGFPVCICVKSIPNRRPQKTGFEPNNIEVLKNVSHLCYEFNSINANKISIDVNAYISLTTAHQNDDVIYDIWLSRFDQDISDLESNVYQALISVMSEN